MRLAALTLIILACAAGGPAHSQQETVIGLAAPLSGDFRILGEQWANGAQVAATAMPARLVAIDDACTEEGGAEAARRLLEAGVSIVIGFLCTPSIEAAMPILAEAGIPVVTPVRTNSLTDEKPRTGWPVYRLGPRADAERDAVADILVRLWRGEFFAIVDDGTIHGRELAENLRAQAELAELRPVFVDTFRPQLDNQIGLVGRLRRTGATHVFVGGDRSDVAIMARDAASLDYAATFVGGEALRAADGPVPLPAGVLMVGLPEWRDLATPEALAALQSARVEPDGYVVQAFAAFQVALQAGGVGLAASEALSRLTFRTAIGDVRFDDKGDLARPLYRLFRYDGEEFVEAE
jgi:branched-chain amino acid transport system substrate-binding protein